MTTADSDRQEDLFDSYIIPSRLAIASLRDSGYKNTAYALAELIDNAEQAGATVIELLCLQKRERVRQRERSRLSKIAVLDNGRGMDFATLRIALQFGNGSYLQDRSGIGRFGMGLPNASISQAGKVEVWSWQNGPDNALYTYLDVSEIESGEMQLVPDPVHDPVPDEWRSVSESFSKSGTLVVWSKLESHRLTWKSARATLENTERLAGRIYRRFIADGAIRIRLLASEEESGFVYDREAAFDDPRHLAPSNLVPAPFDKEPMFRHVFDDAQQITFNGSSHDVEHQAPPARRPPVAANAPHRALSRQRPLRRRHRPDRGSRWRPRPRPDALWKARPEEHRRLRRPGRSRVDARPGMVHRIRPA